MYIFTAADPGCPFEKCRVCLRAFNVKIYSYITRYPVHRTVQTFLQLTPWCTCFYKWTGKRLAAMWLLHESCWLTHLQRYLALSCAAAELAPRPCLMYVLKRRIHESLAKPWIRFYAEMKRNNTLLHAGGVSGGRRERYWRDVMFSLRRNTSCHRDKSR